MSADDEAARWVDRDPRLERIVTTAQAAWPNVLVAAERFVAHLADHVEGSGSLDEIHWSDLYLACACAHGDARAIALFDELFIGPIQRKLSKMNLQPSLMEDLKQVVRQRLLAAEKGALPKIAEYAGRGPLDAWVSAVAVRTALNMLRGRGRETSGPANDLAERPSNEDSPARALAQREQRRAVTRALEQSIGALTARQRLLLRQHFIDGLSADEIGTLHQVSRVTAHRWLVRAYGLLAEQAKEQLKAELQISPDEVESLIRSAPGELDVSIRRLLETASEE